ncbi:TNF receptor-associated factor 4-like isoform X2 [Acropora muricata]|uniref:TNF receptor-associated factor 4-like isoform X2 n=1 Tax=Acropora muricata TaxID=159855 RepID=UPI0034E46C57
MAEARTNPLRFGGYDDEFVNKVEDDLICPICHLPLKKAVQTMQCGHRFCKACIDSHFASQETAGESTSCPNDRIRLNREQDIHNDKAADRKILSYTIKCPNRCQWTGELRAKEVKLQRKELQHHVSTQCDWRNLRCEFCHVSQPVLLIKAHHDVCPKFPVTCPLKCEMTILREKIADHEENQCLLVEISCPYSKLGCPKKFQRREKTSHLHTCMQEHLDLACKKLIATEEELRTTKEDLRTTNKQCKTLEKINEFRAEQFSKLEQRMSSLENRGWPQYNVYTWKIAGFQELLRQAARRREFCTFSDPFYSGECGYKFKMSLYPAGRRGNDSRIGRRIDGFLSLFLTNIEGEYDAILQWPFPKEVTLTLIDQQKNLAERQTLSETITETWKSRPVKGNEVELGFQRFVPFRKLYTRAYIFDDAIFVQAKFDMPRHRMPSIFSSQ